MRITRTLSIIVLALVAIMAAGCDLDSPTRPDIQVSLSCSQLPTPPLTVECSVDASSEANWYFFEWGDGQSSVTQQDTTSHIYVAASTYLISVQACEREEPDGNCGGDDVPLEVT